MSPVFSAMKCLPTVALPSPLSLSRTLHLAKLKLYPLSTDSLCPVSLQSVVIPIALSVSELDFSRYPTEVGPWDTCPFISGLFNFAQSKMFSSDANVKMGNFLSGKRKKVKSLSRVRLSATPWTIAHQAPLSMGFSRQEYWSGLLFSFSRGSSQPRDWTRVSRIAGRCFTVWATREAP